MILSPSNPKDLPAGVYSRNNATYATGEYIEMPNPFDGIEGGYKYKNITLGLGSNREKAIKKANKIILAKETFKEWEKLQAEVSNNDSDEYAIDKPVYEVVSARRVTNINELCDRYYALKFKQVNNGTFSPTSLAQLKIYLDDIKDFWKNYPLEYLDTGNIQAHIDRYFELGKINKANPEKDDKKIHGNSRAAEALKSCYFNLLKVAKKKRLIDFKYNPASETDLDEMDTRVKRSRCSEAVYTSAFNLADNNKNRHYALGFELAVVTKLRLTDLLLIRIERGDDWMERVNSFRENRNYGLTKKLSFQDRIELAPYPYIDDKKQQIIVFQQKTGKIVTIQLNHKVSENLPSVGEIITKIKSTCNADSEFLLHHPKNKGLARKGAAIHPYSISRKFKEIIHELGLDWENVNPPSIGELRSLGARLLEVHEENITIVTAKEPESTVPKRDLVSSTIDESIENAPSANDGITEALGQTDRNIKLRYLDPRNLIFDECVGFP